MPLKFEKLEVWGLSLDLSSEVHILTKSFPQGELYILTSQIKRAADSIALNIAEGATGQTNAEFQRFLSYSIRSCAEVFAWLHLAKRRVLINDQDFTALYNKIETLIKKLQSLRNSIR